MKPRHHRLIGAVFLALLLPPSAVHAEPLTREQAVEFLKPSVPTKGSLEVFFILKHTAMMPRIAAVDFSTGACYQGQEGEVRGRDAKAASYKGPARRSGLVRSDDPNDVVSTDMITLSIPTVVAMDLVRKPELITKAETREDGGIDVWTDLTEGRRWPLKNPEGYVPRVFTFRWEFDERARLKRYSSNMNKVAPEFEYLADGPADVAVCTNAGYPASYQMVSYEWKPDSDPKRFDMSTVEARMVAIDMKSFDDPRRKGMTVEQAREYARAQAGNVVAAASPASGAWTWFLAAIASASAALAAVWLFRHKRRVS
jgi:hypothetical protein